MAPAWILSIGPLTVPCCDWHSRILCSTYRWLIYRCEFICNVTYSYRKVKIYLRIQSQVCTLLNGQTHVAFLATLHFVRGFCGYWDVCSRILRSTRAYEWSLQRTIHIFFFITPISEVLYIYPHGVFTSMFCCLLAKHTIGKNVMLKIPWINLIKLCFTWFSLQHGHNIFNRHVLIRTHIFQVFSS
jgi:hypothetical protein